MSSLDFSNEPTDRAKSLHVHQAEPFNAEPEDLTEFIKHHITPSHLVYGRNHGPIPDIKESSYSLTVNGSVVNTLHLSLSDLKSMPKVQVVAALQVRGAEIISVDDYLVCRKSTGIDVENP
jgi:sulfite oxidase